MLLRSMVEDDRSIRGTYIVALTIQCGRIMDCEEYIQDLSIEDYLGIKSYLNCLSMSGCLGADLLIRGMSNMAARVP